MRGKRDKVKGEGYKNKKELREEYRDTEIETQIQSVSMRDGEREGWSFDTVRAGCSDCETA